MELKTDEAFRMALIDILQSQIPDRLAIDPSLNQRPFGYNAVFVPLASLESLGLLPLIIETISHGFTKDIAGTRGAVLIGWRYFHLWTPHSTGFEHRGKTTPSSARGISTGTSSRRAAPWSRCSGTLIRSTGTSRSSTRASFETVPYLPPGMTAEQARKISNTGPQVGPVSRQSANAGPPAAMGKGKDAVHTLADMASNAASGPVQQESGYNCIFVGSKGYLGTNGRGEGVGLLPGSRWADYKLPTAYLQRSPGAGSSNNMVAHAADWVRACKGGAPACSNFSIAGPYAEWLILGCAAVHTEGKLLWDNEKGEFSNNNEANKWIKPTFRKGWELKL
jgi:hypothetical protein